MASPARGSITTSASMMDKKTQWDATQKQTFTRWANQYLLDRLMEMKNLYEDIGNGLLLGNLAEVISNKKVLTKMAKNPRFQMQKLENLGIVLAFFESEGLKFVNVDPDAMLSGNSKLALGFMWTIILRYAINRGDGEGGKSARAEILDWMAAVSQEPCKNFGCLRDGRILSKIVNHCSQLKGVGNLIDDPDALDRSKGLANNDAAIHKAHDHLGVPMLVDADVFDTDTPEELSSMTYISCYRQLEAKLKEGGEPAAVFAASIELPESIVDGESVTFDTTILCDGEPFTEPTQAAAVESVTVECVAADGGASIPVNVAPSSPIGPTYQCTFVAPAPGDYSLVARRRMKPLAGTPQPFTVLAAVPTINVSVDGDVAKRPVRVQVSASSPRGDILPCSCRVTDANGNQLPIDGDGSFTPLAAGTYTITPVVDGKPIESDATSIVIGEPQLSAEVDAPTSATTGEPLVTKVTLLNAGDPMGEGGEEVKVNGAPATDNGDGTYTATVTPDDPGKFVLSVTGKDDAPLCDPVTVDVASDVASLKLDGAGASPTVAKHAVELDGVFVDHLGRGVTSEVPCSITAKDGNGAPVDVSVKVLDDKTGVVASFTPATPGEYTLTPSKGEPVSVTVTAPQLTAEVDTPTSATTGEPLVTKVTLLNAGDPMGEGGEEVKVNGAPATDNGDGTYTATVTPDDPGKFVLSVTGKDDAPLCDPVTVDVASDVPAIQFDGDEVDPSCAKHTVSVRGTFVDHLGRTVKGGDGETPTVQITDPANVTVPSTLKPLDDDTGVTVTFTPMISGEYTLTPSKGESVSLKIDEPAFSATFDVPATGTTGVALSANLVLLNAGDPVKDGGEHVVVEGAESVKDNGDGTYTVSVVPQNPGNLLLFPSCNGKPLCDSACIVVAADAPVVSVSHENTSDGPAVAKHPVRCRARARNNRDEPVANAVDASTLSVVDPNGNTIPATFTKDDDGNTLVEFFPNQPGDYTVTPANGDPYVVHIGDSDLSATLTAPLSAIAGRPFEVRLSLVNAGDPMTTSVGDDQPVFVNGAKAIDNGDGTYTAKLTAESAGDFTIAPVCASKALCAPTTIPVAADVPHLELLDARAPLVAQLPVVCPGQFKDHAGSPVDPDASAVTVVDSNGNSVPFTLNATDPPVVGAVELTFTPKTPGSYIVRPCNGQELAVDIAEASLAAELSMPERWIAGETSKVLLSLANAGVAMNEGGEPVRLDSAAACVDNGDGTYTASFPNLKEGDLILAPTAHDKPLLESPVTVTVLPRPVGHAEGPGIQQAVSNRRATFSLRIDNDDSGDEAVPSVSVSDSQEVTVESMGDGMHVVQYTPVVSSGTVAVTGTTASGIELFAEPILVPVRPGMRLVVKGPGLENPTTGTANAFNVNVLNDAGQPVLDLPENAICVQATVEGPGAVEVVRSGNRRRVSEMSRSGNKRLSSQSVSDAAPAYLSYVFAYTTETPGDYVVAVDIDDSAEDRVETPVTVRRFVHGVASGAGLITPRVAAVNEFVVATVDHAGQGLNHGGIDVAATLRSLDDPDAAPVACDVVDHGDGKYTCSYMTGVDGEHAVDVLVDGRPVEMSPFYVNVNNQVTASPAVSVIMSDAGAADTSRIAHLGLQGPAEGKPRVWLDQGRHTVAYDVTTPGRYSVVVSGCENIDVSLDDGTPAMAEPSSEDDPTERTLTFVAQGDPSKPVLATVNIGLPASLPLVPLPTVPSFPAVAAAPALSATAVNLGGAGITHPYTDVRNPVTIGLVQDAVPLPPSAVQEHAVDLVVVGPSAVSKAPLVIDDNDAIVRYTVSEPGEYHLSAVVDGMSTGDESSRTVTVSDTVRVRQSGPGLTGALPDEENTFTVQLVDKAGHELTPASGAGCLPMDLSFVSGPVDEATVTVQDKGDGTYECSYVPTAVAPMSYSLKLDGVKEVHGSPFPIKMDEHLAKARASARAEKDRRAAEEARRREQEEREQAEKRRLVAEARRKAADAKAEKLRLAAANRRSAIETQEANRRAAEERAAAEAEAARQRREQVEAARAAAEAARLAAEQRRLEEEARRHAEAEEEARRQAEASRLASTLSPSKIPVASPKKKAAYKPVKGDAMDEEVAKVLNALGIEGVRKGDRPGKYHLGDMVLLIRVLRTGCMVRVGGGWEKLETFLKMHAKQVQQAKTSPCPPRRSAPANSRLTTSVGAAGIQQKHTSLSALRAMQDKADKAKK